MPITEGWPSDFGVDGTAPAAAGYVDRLDDPRHVTHHRTDPIGYLRPNECPACAEALAAVLAA